ncbi:MAG TPA: thermonuclease family protein [Humisphaera sp.]
MPSDPAAIDRFLRRRAVIRRVVFALLLLIASTILIGNVWQQARGGDDWARLDRRPVVVKDVQAGDRIVVENVDGSSPAVVRLIGIDTFDVAGPGQPQLRWGAEAHRALRDRLQGKRVLLRLPPLDPRSRDGEVLAYVYPLDGGAPPADSVNERMVAEGHAYADRRYDHPFHKQFEQAEGEARRKKLGQWAGMRDADQPAWRQAWLKGLKEKDAERAAAEAAATPAPAPAEVTTKPATKPAKKRTTRGK